MAGSDIKYVLVTPARDEEAYIGRTIESVVAQSVLPLKWVVISDGSTDRTDEIVKEYAARHAFIELLRREPDPTRSFGSKVFAIRAGMELMEGLDYDYIGNLDADLSFEPDYFSIVLERMHKAPELGMAGGLIHDYLGSEWVPLYMDPEWSVSGAVQMFRRETYEKIGGYRPLVRGGVDAAAEIMTRMHGWKVRTFPDLEVRHYRRGGAAKGNILYARFRQGIHEYSLGYHPLFEWARCVVRIRQKPYLFGSIFRIAGYMSALLRREERAMPADAVEFLGREQLQRMRRVLSLSKKAE
jgi:glycosyltransferase involved in cell wall biosynthesis